MGKAKAASKTAAAPKTSDPKPTDVTATTPAKRGRPSRKDKENVPSSPIVNPGGVPATANGDQRNIEDENKILRERLAMLEGKFPAIGPVSLLITSLIYGLPAKMNAEPVVNKPKDSEESNIRMLQRPKGEAGDHKKGFILIDAMRLNKNEEKRRLYNSILVSRMIQIMINISHLSSHLELHPSLRNSCRTQS